MLNHIYGILILDKSAYKAAGSEMGNIDRCRDAINRVSTRIQLEAKPHRNQIRFNPIGGISGLKNSMLHGNLPRVIRWYKGNCTFEVHRIKSEFAWQPRYHDRIIRNKEEFQRILDYIKMNPKNWERDRFYAEW